jgi:ATP-dependent Clp protease ATP-binding subunit ClpA
MERVVEKFVAEVATQLRDKKVSLDLAPAARAWLGEKGYD